MQRRQATPEQKAAATAKREHFRKIASDLKRLSSEERAGMAARLGYIGTCEGRTLSVHNCLMLHHQREGVTMVGGFKQWQRSGRKVAKGERGLLIWVAAAKEDKAVTSSDEIRFLTGTVFDVSQTEALTARSESLELAVA